MKKRNINLRKLALNKENLGSLDAGQQTKVAGGARTDVPQDSICVFCTPTFTQQPVDSLCVFCTPTSTQPGYTVC
ncbi:class I lanthipeptide [Taibaiella helva]|uniref:class I lanthipeptide n=1 Tax=Taibaiella helva TaxID=2301235 RepID=UPI000E571046|nr:class I lanthipeptide [Taibaiella helva]